MKRYCFVLICIIAAMLSVSVKANLIVNGDFEQGNTGFSTTYTYNTTSTFPWRYSIKTNPHAWDSGYASFGDHTTGSGNMLLIDASGNAAGGAGKICWSQTTAVYANTDCTFSVWIAQIYLNGLPSEIEFSINGGSVGTYTTPNNNTGWKQFTATWNSGSATTATLAIRELTGDNRYAGNDFALDDISFSVPEPATMTLLALAGLLLRKRK